MYQNRGITFQGSSNAKIYRIQKSTFQVNFETFYRDFWLADFPTSISEVFSTLCTEIKDTEFMKKVHENMDLELKYLSPGNDPENFNTCSSAMQDLLNDRSCQDKFNECFDFKEVQNIPDGENFYGLSCYYWNFWRFLNVSQNTDISYSNAKDIIHQVCDHTLPTLEDGPTDCYEMSYILNLLDQSYILQDLQIMTFLGEAVEWPKGYLAYFISNSAKEENFISTMVFVIVIFFSILLMVLSIIALLTFVKRQCMLGMSH